MDFNFQKALVWLATSTMSSDLMQDFQLPNSIELLKELSTAKLYADDECQAFVADDDEFNFQTAVEGRELDTYTEEFETHDGWEVNNHPWKCMIQKNADAEDYEYYYEDDLLNTNQPSKDLEEQLAKYYEEDDLQDLSWRVSFLPFDGKSCNDYGSNPELKTFACVRNQEVRKAASQKLDTQRIEQYNLELVHVPADGSCLYHSFTKSYLSLGCHKDKLTDENMKIFSERVKNLIIDTIVKTDKEDFEFAWKEMNTEFFDTSYQQMVVPGNAVLKEVKKSPAKFKEAAQNDPTSWGADWMGSIFGRIFNVNVTFMNATKFETCEYQENKVLQEDDVQPTPFVYYNLPSIHQECQKNGEFQKNTIVVVVDHSHFEALIQKRGEGNSFNELTEHTCYDQMKNFDDILKRHGY